MVCQFKFKIELVSGISNAAADALSIFFIYGPEEEDDSEPVKVLNNVCLVQEHSEHMLNTLRKWVMSNTRPEKLLKGNSA